MELPDGAVIPSWMEIGRSSAPSGADLAMSDPYLRIGRILRAHYPDDDTNANGTVVEYDVEVEYVDFKSSHTRQVYPRCTMASLFGGLADDIRFTPRKKTAQTIDDPDVGSMVLLLCINGNCRSGIILAGVSHPDGAKDLKDDGHHFTGTFNGLSFDINKDGELTVAFKGATQEDGTLTEDADENASGSNVAFTKDGSLSLSTKEDDQHLKLDHDAKTIDVKANSELFVSVTDGNVNIESKGTHLGGDSATEALVMGTTYRTNEGQLHTKLASAVATIAGLITTAAAAFSSASAAHAVPVVGPVVGAPFLLTASTALANAVAALTQMQTALTEFEASSSKYISTKNTTD